MARALVVTIALILYGSLYPWEFASRAQPFVTFSRQSMRISRIIAFDFLLNILLYVPLGLTGYLTAIRRLTAFRAAAVTVAGGALLSLTVELLQKWEPYRYPTLLDVVSNTTGTAVGALAGAVASVWLAHRHFTGRKTDYAAITLLLTAGAWMLFPFIPVVSRAALDQKFETFVGSPGSGGTAFVSLAVIWLAACHMFRTVSTRAPLAFALVFVLLIPAQLLVRGRQPHVSDVLAGLAGCALFAAGVRLSHTAVLTAAVILLRGLSPGSEPVAAGSFSWLPFGGFLQTSRSFAAILMLEKITFYGSALWATARSGTGGVAATLAVAAMLALVEVAQIFVPGRTPEITDPVLAVILGFLLVLGQRAGAPSR